MCIYRCHKSEESLNQKSEHNHCTRTKSDESLNHTRTKSDESLNHQSGHNRYTRTKSDESLNHTRTKSVESLIHDTKLNVFTMPFVPYIRITTIDPSGLQYQAMQCAISDASHTSEVPVG